MTTLAGARRTPGTRTVRGLTDAGGHVANWALVVMALSFAACTDDLGSESSSSPLCVVGCADAGYTPPGPNSNQPSVTSAPRPDMPAAQATAGRGTIASTPGTPVSAADAAVGQSVGAPAGDLPCEVKSIVQRRCGSCHGATPMGSPMSLVTLADWHAPGTTDKTKQYHQLAKVRINATSHAMPPPAIGMLAAEEKQTLNAWLDRGAPAGAAICEAGPKQQGSAPANIDVSDLECHKFLAHAPGNKNSKYKVGAVVDAYVNFGFRAPWEGTFYMQVARPVIDNTRVLHHWLIYRESVQDGSVTKTNGQHTGGEMINGWAPGGDITNLRKLGDVGQELPAGTYSIEIHYNSSEASAEDASGVELCGKRTPPQHIASLSWLGYAQGGAISYATGLCLDAANSWTGTCNPGHQEPIHMVVIRPHMHTFGRHIKSVINGPKGSRVLIDRPFDFAYQVGYDTEEVLQPGETITTTCTYSEPKCAGQSTQQEMCYLYVVAWPKNRLVDHGPEGALMHGEGTCLGQ